MTSRCPAIFLRAGRRCSAGVVLLRLSKDKDFDWFGPDSLLPRMKDWSDMTGQFSWFFGKDTAPRFDRWAYWEKFDYWAVYWGALVIGLR